MIFIMPFEQNPYLWISDSFLGIFPAFTMIKLLGLIGFVWAAARIAAGENVGVFTSRQARIFLVFYAGVIFAGLLSGTGFLVVSRYLAVLLFLPFVLVTVRTQDDLRLVLAAMALSLIIVFPYAVRQMIRYNSRLGVGLYETNYFAANLLLVIPIAFALAGLQRTPLKRWLWIGGGLVLVVSLFLTSSRGGFLGLLIALGAYVYRRKGLAGVFAVIALLVLAALPTDLGSRALSTFKSADELSPALESSNRAHMSLLWGALRMIADAPLTGVGPLNFKELSTQYTGLQRGFIAHNTYLELAAEAGLPVLALFLALILATFHAVNRASRLRGGGRVHELAMLADGMRTGLIGFAVAGCFISAQHEKLFWLAVFLSIVAARLAWRHEAAAVDETAEPDPALVPAAQPSV
jgi:O-antigen ligase